MQKLYIKNMVCRRCIAAVQHELEAHHIGFAHIQLGEVVLNTPLTSAQSAALNKGLNELGFEILDDQKHRIIEKIKTIIISQVHHSEESHKVKLSEILSQQINKDYSTLSNLFSEVEGITIEKFLINQRIERVKEMLIYDELTLSEIAYKNGYSSVAHLSAQFKKVTGLTPKHFKLQGINQRKAIDNV
jgi:AraC family transcriptional regulator